MEHKRFPHNYTLIMDSYMRMEYLENTPQLSAWTVRSMETFLYQLTEVFLRILNISETVQLLTHLGGEE